MDSTCGPDGHHSMSAYELLLAQEAEKKASKD
jgi:hypothetical protein